MKTASHFTVWTTLALVTTAVFSPATRADEASRQKNKNDWRNVATAGAVVAGYGLIKKNKTATVLGAAGAGYGAYRYEKDRKSQAANRRARQYYSRRGRDYESYHGSSSHPSTTYVHSTRTTRRYSHTSRARRPPYGNAYGYHRKRGY